MTAPGDHPPPGAGASGIFTGPASAVSTPPIPLPTARMLGAGLVWAAIAAALGAGVVLVVKGADPRLLVGAAMGAGAGWLACGAAIVILRPWRPRPVAQWPFALLGAQALSCMGALFLAGLLYLSTHPDPVSLALATGAAFIGAWVGQVRVFSAHVQVRPGSQPAPE